LCYTPIAMKAVSVSLPEGLAQQTESLVAGGEYVSLSEVLRAALRLFLAVEEKASPELMLFSKRPLNEIKKGLENAGHRPQFVESVVAGLRKSSVYSEE